MEMLTPDFSDPLIPFPIFLEGRGQSAQQKWALKEHTWLGFELKLWLQKVVFFSCPDFKVPFSQKPPTKEHDWIGQKPLASKQH